MSDPALRSEGQPPDHDQGLRVTAVIPALNEEDAIAAVIAALPGSLVGDVVVVDGGSADRTAERAGGAGARVVVEPRPGYGRACLTGVGASPACDVLLFVDGDGSDAAGLQELTYGLPTEMIRNVARGGYRIREVPVDYRRRAGGVSKVSGNPRGSLLAGWHMVRIATR